jgi:hypothetical protein
MLGSLDTLRHWPRRRWITMAVAAALAAALLAAGGGRDAWWAWAAVPLVAGLAALVLASYVPPPGSGRLVEVGCSPCAVAAGVAAAGAFLATLLSPTSPVATLVGTAVLAGATRQRLADAVACAVPPPGRSTPAGTRS